ncbi:MAG: hypothetical protein KGJ86_03945 [Chloroflexota bacterium]|nr:hypothetical protein [Chloroflexota bacterium]
MAIDSKSSVEVLLDQLEAQEEAERGLLREYREAAALSEDKGLRFLLRMILDDEVRHQDLIAAMAEDVRGALLWTSRDGLPVIEAMDHPRGPLLDCVERFLHIEREGLRELKELQHEVRDLRAGLLELLVETMLADTRKHVQILEFAQKRLQE